MSCSGRRSFAGADRQGKTGRGDFEGLHSLALVNRAICRWLLERGIELRLIHVETGPAEDRVTLDARMAKAIWNEPHWEGVLGTWRPSFSVTNRPVGRLAYPIPYHTNPSSGKVGAHCIQDGLRLGLFWRAGLNPQASEELSDISSWNVRGLWSRLLHETNGHRRIAGRHRRGGRHLVVAHSSGARP